MGIRTAALTAGVVLFIPGIVLAQPLRTQTGAVPAARPFVELPKPDDDRGAVPPPKFRIGESGPVAAVSGGSTAEKVSTGAGFAGASSTLLEPVVKEAARRADTLGQIIAVEKVGQGGKLLGAGASIVGLGANVALTGEKCGGARVDATECLQAGLNMASSEASVIELLPAASRMTGTAAGALGVAADGVGFYRNCFGNVEATKLDCVQSTADTLVSAGSMLPGGKVVGAGYSIAKTVLPAAVDKSYAAVFGQSPGAHLYDVLNGDADAKALADAGSPAALETARAKRHAAYKQASGTLQSKQADYEAQQAEIQRQQIAAQQEAQAQAQSQAQSQAMIQNLVGNLQAMSQPRSPRTVVAAITPPVSPTPVASPATYPSYTPPSPQPTYTPPPVAAAPTGCHSNHNEARHPGGCHSAPISGTSR